MRTHVPVGTPVPRCSRQDGGRSRRSVPSQTRRRGRCDAVVSPGVSPQPRLVTVEVLAEVVRSGFVESRHRGVAVRVDPAGEVRWSMGDPGTVIFPRSSNKPLQALGMLRAGLPLDGRLLALASASHSGEPFHLDAVREILALAGLDESALQTPASYPLDPHVHADLLRAGGTRAPIYMDCSGKHAAMLLTCVVNGWSIHDYLDPAHPLQRSSPRRSPSSRTGRRRSSAPTAAARRCWRRRCSSWRAPSLASSGAADGTHEAQAGRGDDRPSRVRQRHGARRARPDAGGAGPAREVGGRERLRGRSAGRLGLSRSRSRTAASARCTR